MKRNILYKIFIISIVLFCSTSSWAYYDVTNSIVYITCKTNQGIDVSSTGIIINEEGFVLTTRHSSQDWDCKASIGIKDENNAKNLLHTPYSVNNVDISVLKFAGKNNWRQDGKYEFVEHCNLREWMVRRPIKAAGFPRRTETLNISYRNGILSNTVSNSVGVIETDVHTTKGMSGGPVFTNDYKWLIGIIVGVKYDALGLANYYGILPVSDFEEDLKLNKNKNECFTKSKEIELDRDRSHWEIGEDVTNLEVSVEDGVCFLNAIFGEFNHPNDRVEIKIIDGMYHINGKGDSSGVHGGSARCIRYY